MARNGEDDTKARGKYALFQVPSHGVCPERGSEQSTYVRLGAASSTVLEDAGGDLLGSAGTAGWASDPSRAGWREHSDGDRFSTTRGNKIDVVSGNYKRVLASDRGEGGSVREDVERKGGVLAIKQQKKDVVEQIEQSGQRDFTFTGPKYATTLGKPGAPVLSGKALQALSAQAEKDKQAGESPKDDAETPDLYGAAGADGAPQEGEAQGGEAAEEEAEEAEEEEEGEASFGVEGALTDVGGGVALTGVDLSVSGALVSTSQTFAALIQSSTTAAVIEEQTLVGKSGSFTLAGVIQEETWAGQTHAVTNVLQSFEVTHAVTATSSTNVGVATETTVAGVMTSMTTASLVMETSLVAQTISSTIGNTIETTVGDTLSLGIGNSTDIKVGTSTEISAAVTVEVSAAATFELKAAVSLALSLAASLDIALSDKTEINIGSGLTVQVGATYELETSATVNLAEETWSKGMVKAVSGSLFFGSS